MVYNVIDYSAVAGGGVCTAQIQRAIDDCFLSGGGEVAIPEGVFLVGGLRLRSGVTLHLLENAILLGSTDPEDYVGFINDEIEPILPEEIDRPVSTVKPNTPVGRSVIP